MNTEESLVGFQLEGKKVNYLLSCERWFKKKKDKSEDLPAE